MKLWKKAVCAAVIAAPLAMPAVVLAQGPPPPAVREVPPPRPYPNGVWIGGHYNWVGGRYVWAPGYWGRPPRVGAVWVPGHYNRRGRWINGHWRY